MVVVILFGVAYILLIAAVCTTLKRARIALEQEYPWTSPLEPQSTKLSTKPGHLSVPLPPKGLRNRFGREDTKRGRFKMKFAIAIEAGNEEDGVRRSALDLPWLL